MHTHVYIYMQIYKFIYIYIYAYVLQASVQTGQKPYIYNGFLKKYFSIRRFVLPQERINIFNHEVWGGWPSRPATLNSMTFFYSQIFSIKIWKRNVPMQKHIDYLMVGLAKFWGRVQIAQRSSASLTWTELRSAEVSRFERALANPIGSSIFFCLVCFHFKYKTNMSGIKKAW